MAPEGQPSGHEMIDVLINYGGIQGEGYGHKEFERYFIPGTKKAKKDPFGKKWDLGYVVSRLTEEREAQQKAKEEAGMDLF